MIEFIKNETLKPKVSSVDLMLNSPQDVFYEVEKKGRLGKEGREKAKNQLKHQRKIREILCIKSIAKKFLVKNKSKLVKT